MLRVNQQIFSRLSVTWPPICTASDLGFDYFSYKSTAVFMDFDRDECVRCGLRSRSRSMSHWGQVRVWAFGRVATPITQSVLGSRNVTGLVRTLTSARQASQYDKTPVVGLHAQFVRHVFIYYWPLATLFDLTLTLWFSLPRKYRYRL